MERREQSLRVWTTPSEYRLFSRLAMESGCSISTMVRTCLLLEADRLGIEQQPATEVRA